MLLIALCIKLDSPGPVIYKQTRVGKQGKPFTFFKFRSMKTNADQLMNELLQYNETGGPTFKISQDPRRTRVGKFIRRASLDELPQLFNILSGHMSFVGPRPPIDREVEQYDDWHHRRLEVTPGLTGLWQVSGRSKLSFDDMVKLDIYYAENWSLWLDIKILIRTIPAVLKGEGAF
jgi:lipopolysaccharide/colanic/teichoic acid biosynthesis glycosyltransferase